MATGNSLLQWTAADNHPVATNPATPDLVNQHLVLDFDATTNEFAVFHGIMPAAYAGTTGLTFHIKYAMSTATSGDVDMQISMELTEDGTTDIQAADSFAGVQSTINTTVPGTAGALGSISVALTDGAQIDSVVAGKAFRVKVTRDAATDTAAGDLELWGLEMKET